MCRFTLVVAFQRAKEKSEETDIMNLMDYPLMEKIYKDYKLLGGQEGLSLQAFVKVMLNFLVRPDHLEGVQSSSSQQKKDETLIPLVRNLTELFN